MQKECDYTPLMVACMKGHIDTAKVLVDHGAIIDDSNSVKFLRILPVSYDNNCTILGGTLFTLCGLYI